jgi:hypothetical protein
VDPPCSIRVSRARTYSMPHQLCHYRAVTCYGPAFQPVHVTTGLSAFARRYLRSRCCFPFLWVLRCFSSPGSLHMPMHSAYDDPQRAGLPHSEIPGSQFASNSPGLIAGSHVLHRLSTPRHPPCALIRLITSTARRHQQTQLSLNQPTTTNACVISLIYLLRWRALGQRTPPQAVTRCRSKPLTVGGKIKIPTGASNAAIITYAVAKDHRGWPRPGRLRCLSHRCDPLPETQGSPQVYRSVSDCQADGVPTRPRTATFPKPLKKQREIPRPSRCSPAQ